MRLKLTLVLAAGLLAAAADGGVQSDKDRLQGSWFVVSAGGAANATAAGNPMIFSGDTVIHRMKDGDKRATFLLRPGQNPKQIDLYDPEAKMTLPGIYRLRGDALQIAVNLGGGDRPKAFAAPKDSPILVVELKRQKE